MAYLSLVVSFAMAALIVSGTALLAFKVVADGEPGALPLLVILGGSVGLWVARRRRRSQDA